MDKLKKMLKAVITVGGWLIAAAEAIYNSIGGVI